MGFFTDFASLFFGEAASTGAAATSGILGKAGEFGLSEALQTGGTLLQAGGAIAGSQAEKKALEQQSSEIARIGKLDVEKSRREAELLKGRQRVAAAKSGAKGGSIFEVMKQSAEEAELEALNIQFGASAGATSRLFEAKQVGRAGTISGAGTFLTGLNRSR